MKIRNLGIVALLSIPTVTFAHTPLFSCYDSGDGTILCEGGFSDGSSALGVAINIRNEEGAMLLKGKINSDGEYEFNKPTEKYSAEFNAGPGHSITIQSDDIVE